MKKINERNEKKITKEIKIKKINETNQDKTN